MMKHRRDTPEHAVHEVSEGECMFSGGTDPAELLRDVQVTSRTGNRRRNQ